MRSLFALFFILPFAAFGAVRGWLVCITLSCYRVSISGYSSSTGAPLYTGGYTGAKKFFWKYQTGSSVPTYQSLGLQQYRDLSGNPIPSSPFHSEFDMYLVTAVSSYAVNDTIFSDSRDLFIPSFDTSVPWMSPIYDSSGGYVYTVEGSNISGVNTSFGSGGSLDILQGRVSMGDNGGSVPMYLYYSNDGAPTFSLTDNGGYEYQYDSNTGKYVPVMVGGSSGGSGSSVDLSPVVSAIESQGGLTRSQLVSLLGANGNSWVYDCSLTLNQLYQLATTYGLPVSMSFNSQLDSIDSGISALSSAINDLQLNPTINVAAPVVNVDMSGVRSDLSTVNSTLSTLNNYANQEITKLSSIHNDLYNYIRPNVVTIRDILNDWNTGNTLGVLPQPDFGEDTPDDNLPSFVRNAWSSDGFASDENTTLLFGSLVDWGDNGAPTMLIPDFISSFLTSFVGQIPTVGSDPVMFDVDFDLPYIGHIQKRFSWADFPYVSDFRALLVWLVYLFFGLACFKLLHKTFI